MLTVSDVQALIVITLGDAFVLNRRVRQQRAMRRLTQPWETPYVRATCDCEAPPRTAVMTRRRFDMADPAPTTHADHVRHAIPMT